jgi:hypothetical protein
MLDDEKQAVAPPDYHYFNGQHHARTSVLANTAGSPPVDDSIPTTLHGPHVLAVFERARAWAAAEQHAVVALDHFLFALSAQQVGAQALQAAGFSDIAEYEVELLNIIHSMPAAPLQEGTKPVVGNPVLEILNHALGFARRDGRASTELADVIAAILDTLRHSQRDTASMASLRKRWACVTDIDEERMLLLEIKEALGQQPTMIARALATELALLRDRVATLETQKTTRAAPWYRRLNILTTLALSVLSSAVGVWTVIG